jgi:hypothetical protein
MTLVVDPWEWLTEDGDLPRQDVRLRRQTLFVARLIEYGGTLKKGESRETLIECKRRPHHRPCMGLLWVTKTLEEQIDAICLVCGDHAARIRNWQETDWATGMMEPGPPLFDDV